MKSKRWMVIVIAMLFMIFHHHTHNSYHHKQTRKRRIQPVHVEETKSDFYLLPGIIPVAFG